MKTSFWLIEVFEMLQNFFTDDKKTRIYCPGFDQLDTLEVNNSPKFR